MAFLILGGEEDFTAGGAEAIWLILLGRWEAEHLARLRLLRTAGVLATLAPGARTL